MTSFVLALTGAVQLAKFTRVTVPAADWERRKSVRLADGGVTVTPGTCAGIALSLGGYFSKSSEDGKSCEIGSASLESEGRGEITLNQRGELHTSEIFHF